MSNPEFLEAEIDGTGPNSITIDELRNRFPERIRSQAKIGTTLTFTRNIKFTFTTEEQLEEFRA